MLILTEAKEQLSSRNIDEFRPPPPKKKTSIDEGIELVQNCQRVIRLAWVESRSRVPGLTSSGGLRRRKEDV